MLNTNFSLTHLDLSGDSINLTVIMLVDCSYLTENLIGDDGACVLADALKVNAALQDLNLGGMLSYKC